MTEEDEVSVCAEGEGWLANAKEQQGYVKVGSLSSSNLKSNVSNLKLFGM